MDDHHAQELTPPLNHSVQNPLDSDGMSSSNLVKLRQEIPSSTKYAAPGHALTEASTWSQ